MNSAQKPLSILVATLALLFEPAVMAAGAGDLVVHSALGEPLRAELRLTLDIEPNCIQVAAPAAANADDLPWIRTARLSLNGNRLRITTREPVNHPAAMLGLRITCGVEFQRDYPILLQPRMERAAAPEISSPTADAPALPRARVTPAGRPSQTAAAPVLRGRGGHSTASRTAAHAKTSRAAASKSRRGDQLIISKDKNPALRLDYQLPASPTTAAAPEPTATKPTISTYDASVSAQLELDEKIKRLEEYQAALRQRITELDRLEAAQRPAPSPQKSQAAPTQPAPSVAVPAADTSPKGNLPDWLIVLGGITAAALAGLALLWIRRQRPEATPPTGFDASLPDDTAFPRAPGVESIDTAAATPRPQAAPMAQPLVAPPPAQSYAPLPAAEDSADWVEPTFAPAHPIPFDETVDEQDSALELAEIMMSFGRTQGAAETLADYIRSNPRQAVKPWLKLLDVYHVAGMRAEFEALTRQLNKTFNVKTITWADFKASRAAPDSIEQMEHVTHQLQELWGTQEAQVYIHQLLRDNRNGTRQGFPLNVVEELLLLVAVLDDTLGTYRPNLELTLADMEPRPASKAA